MASSRPVARPFSQQTVALVLILLVVGALVLGPLLILLWTSFTPTGALPFDFAAPSLENYHAILASAETLTLVRNTLLYAFGSVGIGVLIATAIAWLTERTDMPGRLVVRILMFSWMAIPPVVIGFGWVLLINPGNGAINVLARSLFGATGPILTIYSFWSLIFITSLSVAPTAFVMISGLLRNMDPQLEQAGRVHGAGGVTVMRKVTAPLLTPGLLSVAIFMFMAVVQAFDLPLIIGLTARIPVLSTRVYLLTSDTGLPNYGLSAAFGVLLLLLASLLMWAYFRVIRSSEKFRVVTGRAFRPKRIEIGHWRWPALFGVGLYFFIMILPALMLFWASLHSSYRPPSMEALSFASLDSYARIVTDTVVRRAVGNTVLLVFLSATIVIALSFLIGWFSVRGESRWGKALDVMSFAPTAVPPVVMALAILLLYLHTPFYGTLAILILGHITIYLSFGTRAMTSALMQLHKELGDAALVSGASWLTSLRKITLPLIWRHVLDSWLWVVAHSARDLTIPLMLMTSGNIVAASALWTMWDYPDLPGASALATLLILALLLLVVPVQVLAARRKDD